VATAELKLKKKVVLRQERSMAPPVLLQRERSMATGWEGSIAERRRGVLIYLRL
jgi:hypothetical protein